MFDCGERLEGSQVVARHVHVLQIFVTLNAFERGQLQILNLKAQVSVAGVVESLAEAGETVSENLFVHFLLGCWLCRNNLVFVLAIAHVRRLSLPSNRLDKFLFTDLTVIIFVHSFKGCLKRSLVKVFMGCFHDSFGEFKTFVWGEPLVVVKVNRLEYVVDFFSKVGFCSALLHLSCH